MLSAGLPQAKWAVACGSGATSAGSIGRWNYRIWPELVWHKRHPINQRRALWDLDEVHCFGFSAFRCRSSCCSHCSGITSPDQAPWRGPRIFAGLAMLIHGPACDFCGLICLARKCNFVPPRAANWHDGKSLLIFRNRVKPGIEKYSAFVLTQISRITPLVSWRMRGVGHRHERAVRCDGRESCD